MSVHRYLLYFILLVVLSLSLLRCRRALRTVSAFDCDFDCALPCRTTVLFLHCTTQNFESYLPIGTKTSARNYIPVV